MEPIHYLKAFRRRWWVIVTAVVVAGAAAWATTTIAPKTVRANSDAGFSATTVLWNPGAPIVGQASPFTDTIVLANLVTLPNVSAIAAHSMHLQGDPYALVSQVQAAPDPTTGFLDITGFAPDAKRAAMISDAYATALVTYLEQLRNTRIDQQQTLVEEQIRALEKRNVNPAVIASLRASLSQLVVDRTAPISLTVLRHMPPEPASTIDPTAAQDSGGFKAPTSRTVRVLLACLFGLFAGMALVLVLERFDSRIRTARGAEDAFGLPVLAELPAISRRRRKELVTAGHPYSRAAGAFRVLCVGVRRWLGDAEDGGASTILVTSAEARDGKTSVAANLGAAFAEAGSRVLVVSCDLRRPSIHQVFEVPEEPGLVDLLRSMSDASDPEASVDVMPFLRPCSVVRVAVLPSGVAPLQPGELLGSVAMHSLLMKLRKVTDVVILDCAPLVVASDVVPLLPQVDGVVLVARAGKTRREVAVNAAALVERMGATQVAVVLNDAREFSLPLAKRRMYRPTKEMRRAAKTAPSLEAPEPWIPEPVARDRVRSTAGARPNVVIPDAGSATGSPEPSGPTESEHASRHGGAAEASAVNDLHRTLSDIRAGLEGLRFDSPSPSGTIGGDDGTGQQQGSWVGLG